jgi:hypothetical protein
MNYVAFLSVGVFAALFYVVAAHYDPGKDGAHDYTPSGVIAAIKAGQREQVLIARETHGIKVDERVIAAWEGEKLNRFASMPTATPAADPSTIGPADQKGFGADAWFRLVKKLIFGES